MWRASSEMKWILRRSAIRSSEITISFSSLISLFFSISHLLSFGSSWSLLLHTFRNVRSLWEREGGEWLVSTGDTIFLPCLFSWIHLMFCWKKIQKLIENDPGTIENNPKRLNTSKKAEKIWGIETDQKVLKKFESLKVWKNSKNLQTPPATGAARGKKLRSEHARRGPGGGKPAGVLCDRKDPDHWSAGKRWPDRVEILVKPVEIQENAQENTEKTADLRKKTRCGTGGSWWKHAGDLLNPE